MTNENLNDDIKNAEADLAKVEADLGASEAPKSEASSTDPQNSTPAIPIETKARPPRLGGIDVSHYESQIDWAKVAKSGADFAFIKASEGTAMKDPMMGNHRAAAKANGLIVGLYHFFRPAMDPLAQAKNFLNAIGSLQVGELPPVLDLEPADGFDTLGAGGMRSALIFLAEISRVTKMVPIVYTGAPFMEGLPNTLSAYPLWLAAYEDESKIKIPAPWLAAKKSWSFWQFSDSLEVPGAGKIDVNQFAGSLDDLRKLTKQS